MKCDYSETPDPGKERFFYIGIEGIGIWGHTVDLFTQERYPEDWMITQQARQRGYEYGCWHSDIVPGGELGSQHLSVCAPVSFASFEAAQTEGWPYLGLTTNSPAFHMEGFDTAEEAFDAIHRNTEQANKALNQNEMILDLIGSSINRRFSNR